MHIWKTLFIKHTRVIFKTMVPALVSCAHDWFCLWACLFEGSLCNNTLREPNHDYYHTAFEKRGVEPTKQSGAICDVKLFGTQQYFLFSYRGTQYIYQLHSITNIVIVGNERSNGPIEWDHCHLQYWACTWGKTRSVQDLACMYI